MRVVVYTRIKPPVNRPAVPSSRVKERVSLGSIDSSPKNPRREIAKANHGKALRAAFVAMTNARQKKGGWVMQ